MKRKIKAAAIIILILLVFAGCYCYVMLPAINIHYPGFWGFIILLSLVPVAIILIRSRRRKDVDAQDRIGIKGLFKGNIVLSVFAAISLTLVAIYIIGTFLSSEIVNARKYRELIEIQDGSFTDDIQQISYDEIPLLDRSSAEIVGARKMGTMVEYVSQFEVASDYTQINYKNKPVRITPLEYGNILKWFTNRKEGIPAYIMIDMASQDAECIKLGEGIKYSKSEHFGRLIYRHLRFKYPTYMFDTINLEIDEDGTPYWICPVKKYTIGLFGGIKIGNVVIVNAITGETKDYDVKDVPEWVDHVYSADLLVSYYDYYGTLKHGFLNSVLSQKDCLKTTAGYNYIAVDDDVWVYTGVTSVGGDESNVGFVLMNQRTGLTKYYQIPGAEEFSAMGSAEGKVQNLGYNATFPILLNISGEPTYFMSLKDSAGLVKMYAMVNIQKYTVVATANTLEECERSYKEMLISNHIAEAEPDEPVYDDAETVTGKISRIAQAVVDGNSHYYLTLDSSDDIYDANVADDISIILYDVGAEITLEYIRDEEKGVNKVVAIK